MSHYMKFNTFGDECPPLSTGFFFKKMRYITIINFKYKVIMNLKIAILLLIITSCSSLTKEECSNFNWIKEGELDGSRGRSSTFFSNYSQQCQKHGVSISKDNYIQGHTKGLTEFCNYNSGYDLGLDGKGPFSDCEMINPSFNKGYEEGFSKFQTIAKEKKIEEQKIEEQKDLDRKKGIDSILSSYNFEKCTFNSDCSKLGDCISNKCRHNYSECTYNSDCKIEGNCAVESTYVISLNEWVSVNVCKY